MENLERENIYLWSDYVKSNIDKFEDVKFRLIKLNKGGFKNDSLKNKEFYVEEGEFLIGKIDNDEIKLNFNILQSIENNRFKLTNMCLGKILINDNEYFKFCRKDSILEIVESLPNYKVNNHKYILKDILKELFFI